MSEFDAEQLEKELAKLQPAKPPQDLMRRLNAAISITEPKRRARAIPERINFWRNWLSWGAAIGTAATIVTGVIVQRSITLPGGNPPRSPSKGSSASLKADDVEINQQLVGSFDTITHLADGEPVRLRCREWLDAVVLRDSARGVVIERQVPRLEVVPIRFETY